MNFRSFLALVGAVSTAACFSAVPEQPCVNDAGCVTTDGGAGGGSGGGSVGGGTGGTGGGEAGGAGGSGGGTAGGVGGGGGAGGGTSTNDAGTDGGVCGCMSALGCQIGDSPLACGSAGGTCATCTAGQQCVSGQCMTGTCSPTTCTGGCCANNFCITLAGQNRFTCGKAGAACTACMMGQTCTAGTCAVPPVCDATTCATGCCFNNQCVTMQSRFACGTAGAMCQQCMQGNACSAGACVPSDAGMPPVGDGGMVAVGSACASGQACQPPQGAICIQEIQFGQASGYPGGYCTSQCGPNNPCSLSSQCVTESTFGFSQSSCRANCPGVGTGQSTCRAGYVCVGGVLSSAGYCRPNCSNGGLAACATGMQCGDAGYCS